MKMLEREIGLESRREVYPDAIIVLGSGLELTRNVSPGLKPSWDERMRLTAGAQIYRELSQGGLFPKIIVCGGRVFKGYPALAQVEKLELIRRFGIPEEDILTSERSFNTLSDIEDAAGLLNKEGLGKPVVISNEYHLVAREYAERCGLKFIPAEEVLLRRHKLYEKIVGDLAQSSLVAKLRLNQLGRLKILQLPFGEVFYKLKADLEKIGAKPPQFDPFGLRKMVNEAKV